MRIPADTVPKFDATWGSIARILCWMVFFLLLPNLFLPQPTIKHPFAESAGKADIRLVATIFEDPRFVETLPPRGKGMTIAWVADSTGGLYPPDIAIGNAAYKDVTLIPALTLDRLKKKSGNADIGIDLNMQLGLRSVEAFSSLAAAIKARPAMIVMGFNPFWMFNGWEIHKRQAHLNRAAGLWASHVSAWPWLFSVASPANILWSAAGQYIGLIRDAGSYGDYLPLAPFSADAPKSKKAAKPDGKTVQINMGSVVFWGCLARMRQECSTLFDKDMKKTNNRLWYRELAKMSDPSSGFAPGAVDKMLEMLKDSGIPAFIYVIPTSQDVTEDKDAGARLADIRAHMRKLADRYKGGNVHILADIPKGMIDDSDFRADDAAHLEKPGVFPAFLADNILSVMKQHKLTEKKP